MRKAFTLIELLLVIAIISILPTMLFSLFRFFARSRQASGNPFDSTGNSPGALKQVFARFRANGKNDGQLLSFSLTVTLRFTPLRPLTPFAK